MEQKLSHVIKDGLLHIHAAQRSVIAEAQQVGGMSPGERHAAHRTSVRLKQQHAIIVPTTTLREYTQK